MVWATNERFLPVGFTFGFDLACERCWLQPVVVLTVRWWPTPVSVGGLLANPNRGCSHSSHNVFGGHVNILFNVEVEIITMLIKWSYSSPQTSPPPTPRVHTHTNTLWHVEPAMVIIYWACNQSLLKTCLFGIRFWRPSHTTYHSNIVVQLRRVAKLGMFIHVALLCTFSNSSNRCGH